MNSLFKKTFLSFISTCFLFGQSPVYADLIFKKLVRQLVVEGGTAPSSQGSASLSTSTLNMGSIPVGANSSQSIRLSNTGDASIAITSLPTISGSSGFSSSTNCALGELAAGAYCDIQISFSSLVFGNYSTSGAVGTSVGAKTFTASATAVGATGTLTPTSDVDFGAVSINTSVEKTFTYTVNGNTAISGIYPIVTGLNLSITNNSCGTVAAPVTLSAGTSCSYAVQYAPTAIGVLSGASTYIHSAVANSTAYALIGSGVQNQTEPPPVTSAEVSTTAVDFGSVAVNASSTRTVRLTNTGNTLLALSATPALTDSSVFSSSTNCVAGSMAVNAFCDVQVTFSPSVYGGFSSSLVFNTSAGVKTVEISATGQGATGALVPQNGLDFGAVNVGSYSEKTFIYTVTGNMAATGVYAVYSGSGVSLSSNTCGTQAAPVSVAAGANCAYTVRFTPSSGVALVGAQTNLVSSLGDSPVYTLSGSGLAAADAQVSTSSLNFGQIDVGSNYSASITLYNQGQQSLSVTAPSLRAGSSSDFGSLSTNCPASLSANQSCTVQATFTPSAKGQVSGTIDITTSDKNYAVALSGTGLQAIAQLSASTVNFDGVAVGATNSQSITLTNIGNKAFTISTAAELRAGSDSAYTITSNTCTAKSLAGDDSCSVTIGFTPTSSGLKSANLDIATSLGLQQVSLSGTGQQAVGQTNPTSFNFGAINVGSAGSTTVSYSNVGNTAATGVYVALPNGVSSLSLSANTCGSAASKSTVAVNGSCSFTVQYAPSSYSDTLAASVTINADNSANVSSVALSGSGLQAAGSLSTTSLPAFSLTEVSVANGSPQSFRLDNVGNAVLHITSANFTGAGATSYAYSSTCGPAPFDVPAGGFCTVTVGFTPVAAGTLSAALNLVSSAATYTVAVSGTAANPSGSITSNSWGTVLVNTTASGWQQVTNTGTVPLRFTGTAYADAPFAVTVNHCPSSLAVGASCYIDLSFSPTAVQSYTQKVYVPTAAGTLTSTASAVGISPNITFNGSGAFGTVGFGSSNTQTFTYTNSGNTAATGVYVVLTNADSTVSLSSNTCGTSSSKVSVATGNASCSFTLVYTPNSSSHVLSASKVEVFADNTTTQTATLTGAGGLASDPYFGQVAALFQFDSSVVPAAAGSFTSTTHGTAPSIVSSPAKYGAGALNFSSSGTQILSGLSSSAYGANDFTIEMWVRPTTSGVVAMQGENVGSAGVGKGFAWYISVDISGRYYLSIRKASNFGIISAANIGTGGFNNWSHLAISRNGDAIRAYLNGTLTYSYSVVGLPAVNASTNSNIYVGGMFDGTSSYAETFRGQIDDFRITVGTGRYTSNFTPTQAAPY